MVLCLTNQPLLCRALPSLFGAQNLLRASGNTRFQERVGYTKHRPQTVSWERLDVSYIGLCPRETGGRTEDKKISTVSQNHS